MDIIFRVVVYCVVIVILTSGFSGENCCFRFLVPYFSSYIFERRDATAESLDFFGYCLDFEQVAKIGLFCCSG